MKKSFLTYVTPILIVLPVISISLWHMNNQGLPKFDAAEYMITAYQQYLAFQDGSLLDGIKALYQIRGWRPTFFPLLATPFLLLFKGNVHWATGATMILLALVCQIYLYAIARRYLDSLRASLAAVLVGSCPVNFYLGTVFLSEVAWLAVFAGFVFHLLKSEFFSVRSQSMIAGLFLGMAALLRPAETVAMIILPLIGLLSMATARKYVSIRSVACISGFVFSTAGLLMLSAFIQQINYRLVLGIGMVIILLQILLFRKNKQERSGVFGLSLFAVSFMAINLLWWADSMPDLYAWVYENSFGSLAGVQDLYMREKGVFSFLVLLFSLYLFPHVILMSGLCLALLLPAGRRDAARLKRLVPLAVMTIGLLIPILVLYVMTSTSDVRRIFIGMNFLTLLLAILSLQDGFARKIRCLGIVLILTLFILGQGFIIRGALPPIRNLRLNQYYALAMPRTSADQNEVLIPRLMELGVPPDSTVAVYPHALFEPDTLIYESAALKLASLAAGTRLNIFCLFNDINDVPLLTGGLRELGVSFFVVDVYHDPGKKIIDPSAEQFVSASASKNNGQVSYGLKKIATFSLNGREQALFKVLPLKRS